MRIRGQALAEEQVSGGRGRRDRGGRETGLRRDSGGVAGPIPRASSGDT